MSGTEKLLPKTWKKELDGLKAESAKIKHDLAENDAILGGTCRDCRQGGNGTEGKSKKRMNYFPILGRKKAERGVSGQKRKHEEEIS